MLLQTDLLGGLISLDLLLFIGNLFSVVLFLTLYVSLRQVNIVCGFVIPPLTFLMLFLCLPGYLIWYLLLARHFWRMGRG